MSTFECSILLLAGGLGQRMGGQDKGLVMWQGQPLITYAQRLARPLTEDLIISCNRNFELYADYADQLISDGSEDFDGPLAGIRAGLAAARYAHMLVLPCDAPKVDSELINCLLYTAREHPALPVMIRHGEHWEPLFCVIPTAVAPTIELAWEMGERSPRRLMLQLNARALQCAENDSRLTNFNTRDLLN